MRFILTIPALALLSCMALKNDPDKPASSNNFQNEFLNRVNKLRTSGCKCGRTYMPPVEPVTWNNALENSAFNHARDMYRRRYFAHTSLSGKSIKNRIEEAGYTLSGLRSYAYGENIAAGQKSIDQVMNSWIRSEGHCKNIMNKNFREIGVAEVNLYWVQDFGARN
ncbi:MAG: CAP domain-containing protein [Daejeonella sp.]|uniref:CAP domain-containing protein n=1 Tax=Daejeonella sp. JGW-45 TaxID=3034148 RepID=UPI0023ED1D6F|nr:CAP domain-containing protein [Daejeonella sp. JGW-45]